MLVDEILLEVRQEYEASGIGAKFEAYAALFGAVAFAAAVAAYALSASFPTQTGGSPVLAAVIAFAAVASIALVVPHSLKEARVKRVEDGLADALRSMATILKTGGTVESAFEETAKCGYGPLSETLGAALAQLKRGKTFEGALAGAAAESQSKLFSRMVMIISDARKSGAGLADTMLAIAEDAAEVNRLARERASRTLVHAAFLYSAALLLSPFIFGFTLAVVAVIGTGIGCAVPDAQPMSTGFLDTMLTLFLAVEVVLVTLAVGVIRGGKMARHAVRIPIMILIAFAIYEVGKRLGAAMITGGGACN